jgi:hypothetical protein
VPQDAAHVTAKLAENCCVWLATVVAAPGVIAIGDETFTLVDAVWPLPSVAVPVTVHLTCASGAVKFPDPSMPPQLEAQFVGAFAVKTWMVPSVTVGLSGEIA